MKLQCKRDRGNISIKEGIDYRQESQTTWCQQNGAQCYKLAIQIQKSKNDQYYIHP